MRKLRPREQGVLVFLHRADDSAHLPIGKVEVKVLAVDLHIGELRKRHAHDDAAV